MPNHSWAIQNHWFLSLGRVFWHLQYGCQSVLVLPLYLWTYICGNNGYILPHNSFDCSFSNERILAQSYLLLVSSWVSFCIKVIFQTRIQFIHFSKYALKQLFHSVRAICNGEDLPPEPKNVVIFHHKVTFIEVLSESIPQVALHCLVLSEFGLNTTSFWTASSQLLSLVTSLISICLAFGKVCYVTISKKLKWQP